MKKILSIVSLMILVACGEKSKIDHSKDTPVQTVQEEIKKGSFELSFDMEQTAANEYEILAYLSLHDGAYVISPHSADKTYLQFDIKLAENLDLGSITSGLPQGLVSAGFLANASLNTFDKEVGKAIGDTLSSSQDIVLHDYCRYVDDLRLVVSADNLSIGEISKVVNNFVKKLLKEQNLKLSILYFSHRLRLLHFLQYFFLFVCTVWCRSVK